MVNFQSKSHKPSTTGKNQTSPTQKLPDHSDPLSIEYLQRTIGNQATINLMQHGMLNVSGRKVSMATQQTGDIQRAKKRRRRGRRRRKGGGGNQSNTPSTPETETPQTWANWFWSWAPSYNAPDNDEEEGLEIEDDPNYQREGGGSVAEVEGSKAWTQNRDTGETDEMDYPEDEDASFENPFAIEKLELDLGEVDFSSENTAIGNVKGKAKSSISGDGKQSYSGRVTTEGSMGSGEATGKVEMSEQEMKGEGKVGFLLGASNETKLGSLGWGSDENSLKGEGKMETKVGINSEMAAKIAYNLEKMEGEASGKLGAFFGAATEGTVDIKLKANGQDLTTTQGKLGISYGVGGEITGFIKWDSGTLSFGNQGKLSAGLGFSYGYSVSINTNAIASASGSAAKSGLSWLWSWAWGS